MFPIKQNQEKGFTLLELLVTIAIVSLLTAMLLVIAAEEENSSIVRRVAFQLAQDVREVQNLAMGAAGYQCGAGETKSFGIFAGSVAGVWNNYYYIFADCNSDNQYIAANDKIIRQVTLPSTVKINSITVPLPADKMNITFRPPDPVTTINGTNQVAEAVITLSTTKAKPPRTRTVRVNAAGRIQVE